MMKSKDLYVVRNWSLDLFRVTPAVFTTCVDLIASGSRGYSPIPNLSGNDVTRVAAEALDVERVMREWDGKPVREAPVACDLALAVLAAEHKRRALEAAGHKPDATKTPWVDGHSALLQKLLDSPYLDFSLNYEPYFYEAARLLILRGDSCGLEYMQQSVAFTLQYERENISGILHRFADLAMMLPAPHRDFGISLYAALLRLRPADIWTYNSIVLASHLNGLVAIGLAAIDRGEALISEKGDKNGLIDQFALTFGS